MVWSALYFSELYFRTSQRLIVLSNEITFQYGIEYKGIILNRYHPKEEWFKSL